MNTPLIPLHGGYRQLLTFKLARLVYDLTLRFCDRFIERKSRTHDQMVQAARSGVQNIAEGSQAAGTSKKTELKLTNVARSSLEELILDYEDFLRQRNYPIWIFSDSRRNELIAKKLTTPNEVVKWAQEIHLRDQLPIPLVAANAILVLTRVACRMLDRQLKAQADMFVKEGGFTERLYNVRKNARNS